MYVCIFLAWSRQNKNAWLFEWPYVHDCRAKAGHVCPPSYILEKLWKNSDSWNISFDFGHRFDKYWCRYFRIKRCMSEIFVFQYQTLSDNGEAKFCGCGSRRSAAVFMKILTYRAFDSPSSSSTSWLNVASAQLRLRVDVRFSVWEQMKFVVSYIWHLS